MPRPASFVAALCLYSSSLISVPLAEAQESSDRQWTQNAEFQPTVVRGQAASDRTESARPKISDADMRRGRKAEWIWGPDNNRNYVLESAFEVPDGITAARLFASCDNEGIVSLNGRQVASGSEWQEPMSADVLSQLRAGRNVLSADVRNHGGIAAFVLKLVMQTADGGFQTVVSDTNWVVRSENLTDSTPALSRGEYGDQPWGSVFDNAAEAGRVPRGVFEVPEGFRVEKLFTVPRDELGSWVCITFDNKGRLLASDQGGKGICRITLPDFRETDADVADQSADQSANTSVERLDFSGCEFQPTAVQGMLWAFDALYLSINGGPGSGLYRARDTDGDDQFDECVRLKSFRGGGEHGPHSLRLSPDGQRIFVICGNHTDPPFQPGEEMENENYSSRIPTNWGEDLLLPRMWDANGHARGKLAPGGWIASTDPDGVSWEIWSTGYRNPYDMAFNADGELFAYDADMEWDIGLPWYRPTRVVHATSGSEFGWRSGSGKWPEYHIDSLPPLVNIGPGSPVGVEFGYGPPRDAESEAAKNAWSRVPAGGGNTSVQSPGSGSADSSEGHGGSVFTPLAFPEKYQKALYICDWTFGTMYAIHMEPSMSSYSAVKEEFLSRTPLPLTDVAAGPDGALYFTIGGRGTQSELYRVTHRDFRTASAARLTDPEFADRRETRRLLERYHSLDTDFTHFVQELLGHRDTGWLPDEQQLTDDLFLAAALRSTTYNPSAAAALMAPLRQQTMHKSHRAGLVVAMVRGLGRNGLTAEQLRPPAMKTLSTLAGQSMNSRETLDLLRALSLIFIRLGEPSDAERQQWQELLQPKYPSDDDRINRELCSMLVYLRSPVVVAQTVELLNREPEAHDDDMADLLARNAGYGRAIRASIDNPPDKQQIWYAYCLRCAEVGWTPELRADFYRWFGRAKQWSGGNSFRKFLQNMEDEAWQRTPFDDRVLVEAAGARTPYKVPELPRPKGPGHDWTPGDVRSIAADGLQNRDFENGRRTFAATRCIVCHRFAGDGGATGPDLTQLAGRFSIDSLTEAILEPSKVISDQYKASTVITADGRTVTGRIVSENDSQISVLTDPEDSTKIIDIPKDEIEETVESAVSIMPQDLLKPLSKDEVLDLLAYLLSRGDEKDRMFRQ